MMLSSRNSSDNIYYYYSARKKHSMKRRRPTSWASRSTIIATTALLTAHLWTQTAGIPIFLDLETNNNNEFNNYHNKQLEDLEDPQELDVESPTNSPTFVILRQSLDLSYDIVLRAERGINMDDLLGNIEVDMEEYVFFSLRENLDTAEDEGLQVRKVDLDATLLTRRRMTTMMKRQLRVLQGSTPSQDITVEVDGSIQYDLDRSSSSNIAPEEAESLLEEELAASLTVEKMATALSDVDGVLGVYGVSLEIMNDEPVGGDDDMNNNQGTNDGGENTVDDTTNDNNNGSNALSENNSENDSGLERPSTLSIVFGFLLTGIAFLGLVAYAYIFYRKRKKRLRRKKQMKESIQYHLPAPKVSPVKRSAPQNNPSRQQIQMQQQQSSTLKVVQQHPENSEESSNDGSYEGLESESEAPSDAFARELQMAASLDEQAWEDFQRKKEALGRNEVIRAADVGSAFGQYDSPGSSNTKSPPGVSPTEGAGGSGNGTGAAFVKSFPYGDEQSVMEEGIEWTDEDNDKGWNPYGGGNRSMPSAAKAAEEKKDEWGADEDEQIYQHQQQQPLASESTAALLESIQRDLAKHGTQIDPEPRRDDLTSSDVVLEVERLSRYVKRYEQRKERRVKREVDSRRSSSTNRSSDVSSIPSPPHHYTDNSISSRSTFERSSMPPNRIISSRNGNNHPDSIGITEGDRPLPSRGENNNMMRNGDHLNNGDRDMNIRGGGNGGYYSTNQKENFQMQEQAPPTRATAPYSTPYDVHSAASSSLPQIRSQESDGRSEDSFDYNFQADPDQEGSSIRSGQRLGITPFDSQNQEEPSFNYSAMSPMMQKLAKAEALRSSGHVDDEGHSLPTDERIDERGGGGGGRRRRASDGEAYTSSFSRKNTTATTNRLSGLRGSPAMLDYTGNVRRLSDLRDNKAIIDSSQSDIQTDVNVTYWQSPEEAERKQYHQQQQHRGGGVVGGNRNNQYRKSDPLPPPSSTNLRRTPTSATTDYSNNNNNNGNHGKPSPTRRGSGKFNKLRNLFEERQNEAIFPPDQHWQYGVAKS